MTGTAFFTFSVYTTSEPETPSPWAKPGVTAAALVMDRSACRSDNLISWLFVKIVGVAQSRFAGHVTLAWFAIVAHWPELICALTFRYRSLAPLAAMPAVSVQVTVCGVLADQPAGIAEHDQAPAASMYSSWPSSTSVKVMVWPDCTGISLSLCTLIS